MKILELLENHPKAAKIVRQHYLERLIKSLDDKTLPDEFKEHVRQQGITNDVIAKLISEMPRSLFDVFDENEIYIEINVITTPKKEDLFFSFAVNNVVQQNGLQAATYKTRREAEQESIKEAFKLLENVKK